MRQISRCLAARSVCICEDNNVWKSWLGAIALTFNARMIFRSVKEIPRQSLEFDNELPQLSLDKKDRVSKPC